MARRFTLCIVAGTFLLATALTACGNNDSGSSDGATGTASEGSAVAVDLKEFAISVDTASVPAGSVTFSATNSGPDDEHEMVIMKTDLGLTDLPVDQDGAVIEDGEGVEAIGEIGEFSVGGTPAALTVDLAAGSYVLICNVVQTEPDGSIESHYQKGMRTEFTVA